MQIIRWRDLTQQPWKNGGGTTREVWAEKGSGNGFDWRVSVAEVSAPGAFSLFPGYDRIIMPLSDWGMQLILDGNPYQELQPLRPFVFPGELAISAELPHGPVTDFNFIVRREFAHGRLEVLQCDDLESPALPQYTRLVFVLSGTFTTAGFALGVRDSLLLPAASAEAHVIAGRGNLACCKLIV